MLVMPSALPGVHPNEYFLSREHIGPVPNRVEIVERHPHALLQAPFVLRSGGEVGREEDAFAIDIGHKLDDSLDLTGGHALEVGALLVHEGQDSRVGVRLHGVKHPIHRLEGR